MQGEVNYAFAHVSVAQITKLQKGKLLKHKPDHYLLPDFTWKIFLTIFQGKLAIWLSIVKYERTENIRTRFND